MKQPKLIGSSHTRAGHGLDVGSSNQSCGSFILHVQFMLVSDDKTGPIQNFTGSEFLRCVFQSEHAHLFDSSTIACILSMNTEKLLEKL